MHKIWKTIKLRYCVLIVEALLLTFILSLCWEIYVRLSTPVTIDLPMLPESQADLIPIIEPDHGILTKFDPFYRLGRLAPKIRTGHDEAVPSIILTGTSYQENGEGRAILKLNDGEQQLFIEGDTIFADVKLTKVLPKKVHISSPAGDKTILLNKYSTAYFKTAKSQIELTNTVLYSMASFSSPDEVQKALKEINTRPYSGGPYDSGLEIMGVKDLNDLTMLGLEQGDVIYDPSEEPMNSQSRLMDLAKGFKPESSMQLIVYRPSEQSIFSLYIG